MYDEYGEVIMEDDGSYYYSPHESEGEVSHIYLFCFFGLNQYNVQYFLIKLVLSCPWLKALTHDSCQGSNASSTLTFTWKADIKESKKTRGLLNEQYK